MTETVPVSYFFREFDQMPVLEQTALDHCRGSVLDIGCGAGSHSLYLQSRGLTVTGLDQSCTATRIAEQRGVRNTVCSDILEFGVGKFDTLLLLMNGIGLAGTLEGLGKLLEHLAGLLNPGGQILLDSSDLIYLFETDADGGVWIPGDVAYYGEVTYQWVLGGEEGNPFPWLFVDFHTLGREATRLGYETTLLESGPHYDYLARLSR
jgi:SAM-dependent methyltransferase